MIQEWHSCRYCHEASYRPEEDMVKYGPRHWMHKKCYIASGKPLGNLRRSQVEGLPYFALKEAGLLDEVRQIIGAEKLSPILPA